MRIDLFEGISPTVDILATSGTQVHRLLPGQVSGPALSLPVYPGDTIEMQVQGYYRGGTGASTADVATLISAVASTFGGLNGGGTTEQTIFDAFDGAINPSLGGFGLQQPNPDEIAVYLNYIMFDKNMKLVQHGHWEMDDDALENPMLMKMDPAPIAQHEGFVFVYLTNESNSEVYFDDFEITIKESMVVQNTNYYPFGLQHATSWTRPTDLKNNFLYNAGSELNEKTKNYEMFYRDYDPALGRFNQIDPLAASFDNQTPYNYAFNDPVSLNDPNGDCPSCDEYWAGREQFFQEMHMDGRGNGYESPYGYGSNYGAGAGYSQAVNYNGYGRDAINDNNIYVDAMVGAARLSAYLNMEVGVSYSQMKVSLSHDPTEELRMFGYGETIIYPRGELPSGTIWIPGNSPDPNAGVGLSGNDGYIPVWGSARDAVYWAQQGDVSRAALNAGLAISDVFLVKAAGMAIAKVGVKTVAKGGTTVLGHYPAYTKLAGELGAKRFNIPTNVWNKMTPAQQWGANQKFLDRMILRGDNIRLATPLNQVKPGSFYQKELNYLFDKGYKVSSDGLWLVK